MMETEGRIHGLELDRRHNARDMWKQLSEHMMSHAPQASMMCEVEMTDPMMHTHDDGMTHSHDGGDMEHSHAAEDMDGLPSDVEPNFQHLLTQLKALENFIDMCDNDITKAIKNTSLNTDDFYWNDNTKMEANKVWQQIIKSN